MASLLENMAYNKNYNKGQQNKLVAVFKDLWDIAQEILAVMVPIFFKAAQSVWERSASRSLIICTENNLHVFYHNDYDLFDNMD